MPTELRSLLACPTCRADELSTSGNAFACESCGAEYPSTDGIPVLLPTAGSTEVKLAQALHFDEEVADEFEITRPNGTPALYRWLMAEKFRRSVVALQRLLPGATVLTVCGGSGMDAEFLARAGARVIASDLSLGAARRAQERARRYGLEITPVVADAERLPFRAQAVDLAYVHDGLHHLEDPEAALAEMARVASRGVSVNEPARAALTAGAVRLGLAEEREEAGNVVARLAPADVAAVLERQGFRVVRTARYGMFYRHEPGPIARTLSRKVAFEVATRALLAANLLASRVGNKLTVQAVRP